MATKLRLSEADLRFLVETVVTKRPDHDRVVDLVRGKEDLLEPMLRDPKLVERMQNQQEPCARVSPYLLFAALLRRMRADLEQRSYVYEVGSGGKRIPVFEAPEAVALLSEEAMLQYLVEMLCSFIRTNTGVVYWQEGGTWHRRKFNDTDLDDMIELARLVPPELKSGYFRRIADLALFWSGIYPEQAVAAAKRPRHISKRTLDNYEREGERFYQLAAREASPPDLEPVLKTLAVKFSVARRALNTFSDQYLRPYRAQFFE